MNDRLNCQRLLKSQATRLKELKGILEKYTKLSRDSRMVILSLIDFYNEVADFTKDGYFDTGRKIKMKKHFPDVYTHLKIINYNLKEAGKTMFGLNRTRKGEKVTADTVYLGGIYGVMNLPASKWLYDTPEDHFHHDIMDRITNRPIWLTKFLVDRQVRPCMEDHVRVIESIDAILQTISKFK